MVFAIIYKWKVTQGKEKEFERLWRESTLIIMKEYNSLGSSLHKTTDGYYMAYARWPKLTMWNKMMKEYDSTEEINDFWEKYVREVQDPIILQLIDDKLKLK